MMTLEQLQAALIELGEIIAMSINTSGEAFAYLEMAINTLATDLDRLYLFQGGLTEQLLNLNRLVMIVGIHGFVNSLLIVAIMYYLINKK
jgi:hypothetical protein